MLRGRLDCSEADRPKRKFRNRLINETCSDDDDDTDRDDDKEVPLGAECSELVLEEEVVYSW